MSVGKEALSMEPKDFPGDSFDTVSNDGPSDFSRNTHPQSGTRRGVRQVVNGEHLVVHPFPTFVDNLVFAFLSQTIARLKGKWFHACRDGAMDACDTRWDKRMPGNPPACAYWEGILSVHALGFQAESRFLPLARRRRITSLPWRVAIRVRNPWVRLCLSLLG